MVHPSESSSVVRGRRRAVSLSAVAFAGLLLCNAASAFGALNKCQATLEGAAAKFQTSVFGALQKCADAVRKEQVKAVTSGKGTGCTGGGCLAKAAKACEKMLQKVYDAANQTPGKSKSDKFRLTIEKTRNANAKGVRVCEDTDLGIAGGGMGHLLSGPGGTAPPVIGDAARFLTTWWRFALEKATIEPELTLVPDLLNVIQAAVAAGAGPTNLGGIAPQKGTSCSPSIDVKTQEFRPNLCRFGLECRQHACQLDSSGAAPGATFASVLSAPAAGAGAVRIPLPGTFTLDVCEPGPAQQGQCRDGTLCTQDADCPAGEAPCNFFAGTGAGVSSFNPIAGILYLSLRPSATFVPPPSIPGAVAAVCARIVRGEGWCDCNSGGSGIQFDTDMCEDRLANAGHCADGRVCIDSGDCGGGACSFAVGASDECGSPKANAANDPIFAPVTVGVPNFSPSGASTEGDCLLTAVAQFKVLSTAADFGPDGVPCTVDDFGTASATISIPLTTGSVTATIRDAVQTQGACNLSGTPCLLEADCPAGESCDGEHLVDLTQGPLSGAKVAAPTCANLRSGNLSKGVFVSAFATAAGPPLGDVAAQLRLTCQ
jgi:hypothetical protein